MLLICFFCAYACMHALLLKLLLKLKIKMDNKVRRIRCSYQFLFFYDQLSRAADVWSLGCILHQMVFGKTPFSHLKKIISKIHAITDKNQKIPIQKHENYHINDIIKRFKKKTTKRKFSFFFS